MELTKRYTDFTELTTPMLNEFIEKVVIYERVKEGRYTKYQQIDVYFNFVGMVDLPKPAFVDSIIGEVADEIKTIIADSEKRYVPKGSAFIAFGEYLEQQGKPLCKSVYKFKSYWYPSDNRPMANVIYNAGYDVSEIDLKIKL